MKIRAGIFLTAVFLLAVAHMFAGFIDGLGGYGQSEAGADAIVVLTGGSGRAEAGLRLLREGRAGTLVLSGVNRDAGLNTIFLSETITAPERAGIVLEKNSASTFQNALEVRRIAQEQGIESILLLTSSYHMERAHYIFRRVLPPEVSIASYPVASPNFDVERWWQGSGALIASTEFVKFMWYRMRFRLEDMFRA